MKNHNSPLGFSALKRVCFSNSELFPARYPCSKGCLHLEAQLGAGLCSSDAHQTQVAFATTVMACCNDNDCQVSKHSCKPRQTQAPMPPSLSHKKTKHAGKEQLGAQLLIQPMHTQTK